MKGQVNLSISAHRVSAASGPASEGNNLDMNVHKGKRRVAVVLSGGGGKGAYQVGMLKALKSFGVEPDIYCGTSVGSFNCGMIASGKSLEEVEQVWRGLNAESVFKLRCDPRQLLTLDPRGPIRFALQSARIFGGFLAETLKESGSWWDKIDLDSFLLDTSPLGDLISKNVDLETLRKSKKEFILALTQLKPIEGYPLQIVSKDKVTHKHILASCSLPLLFPPVTIGNRVFCDGGVVMNSPLKPAIDAGAEEIYVLDLTPPPRTYYDGTLPLAYQVMSAQLSAMLERDLAYAEDLNNRFLAAHLEGRLVDGKVQVRKLNRLPENRGNTVTKQYRYLRLYVIRPITDLEGIGGFLKFSPNLTAKWLEAGEREAKEILERHYEQEFTAPDDTKVQAVFSR